MLSGRGLLVCVSGEAGIGKTNFIENLLHGESAQGCFIGRGKCSEHLAGTGAYLPILEAIESLTRFEKIWTSAVRRGVKWVDPEPSLRPA